MTFVERNCVCPASLNVMRPMDRVKVVCVFYHMSALLFPLGSSGKQTGYCPVPLHNIPKVVSAKNSWRETHGPSTLLE